MESKFFEGSRTRVRLGYKLLYRRIDPIGDTGVLKQSAHLAPIGRHYSIFRWPEEIL